MHNMTDHKTIEDVIRNSVCWEDFDSFLVIGSTENGRITATKHWDLQNEETGTNLLEVLYDLNPECYCDEDENT